MFDLDGTLLNTLSDIASSVNEILARNDYPQHPLQAYAIMVGNGFPTLIRRALPADRMPDAQRLDKLVAYARQIYQERMLEDTIPYPGIIQALHTLASRDYSLSVLSNKPDNLTKALIRHFFPEIPFSLVTGGSADFPLKPDPSMALHMLETIKIRPENCVYAGDSCVDMETAHRAAMPSLGAAWGFRGGEELAECGASRVINHPYQIPEAVASLLNAC